MNMTLRKSHILLINMKDYYCMALARLAVDATYLHRLHVWMQASVLDGGIRINKNTYSVGYV
jgi:hypothetical protein